MEFFNAPVLSACVVLYNSTEKAARTIECFQNSDIELSLYVVDNAASSGQGRTLQWQCPEMHYRPQKKNLGYGGGNNAVLDELRSRYHLICNPDVTFDETLLRRMVEYMESDPECAILTPRVLNPDGTEQYLPKRAPRLKYLIGSRLDKLGRPFAAWRSEYTMRGQPIEGPTYVHYATGCFMLVRTGYLRQLNGFDPQFFLYHEDSDLSRRALRKGSIVYHPDFCITHDWQRDSSRRFISLCRHILSTVKYFNKWGWQW